MPRTLSLVFCILCFTVNYCVYSEKNESTFVASREWQPVKKGQPIPSGLHVRHNFQTGVTEAKLLDDEESSSLKDEKNDSEQRTKLMPLHTDEFVQQFVEDVAKKDKEEPGKQRITLKEFKARLKKIRFMNEYFEIYGNEEEVKSTADERTQTIADLESDLKDLEVNVTTDAEMLVAFFDKFEARKESIATDSISNEARHDVLQILNDMEYLLYQIDNARTFADMGGMAKIVSPCLNSTKDDIKIASLRLLGTAVQSNPKVQAKALDHDFVQKLLHILINNNRPGVQSGCLFALSALVRQYPAAQKALVDHRGLEIFGQILEEGHEQTQTRIIILITDLVVERNDLGKYEDEELRRRKTTEYAATEFEQRLHAQSYCTLLNNLMKNNIENSSFLSVIVDCIVALGSSCKNDIRAQTSSLIPAIKREPFTDEDLGSQLEHYNDEL